MWIKINWLPDPLGALKISAWLPPPPPAACLTFLRELPGHCLCCALMRHVALVGVALPGTVGGDQQAALGVEPIAHRHLWESFDPLGHLARIPLDVHW